VWSHYRLAHYHADQAHGNISISHESNKRLTPVQPQMMLQDEQSEGSEEGDQS